MKIFMIKKQYDRNLQIVVIIKSKSRFWQWQKPKILPLCDKLRKSLKRVHKTQGHFFVLRWDLETINVKITRHYKLNEQRGLVFLLEKNYWYIFTFSTYQKNTKNVIWFLWVLGSLKQGND